MMTYSAAHHVTLETAPPPFVPRLVASVLVLNYSATLVVPGHNHRKTLFLEPFYQLSTLICLGVESAALSELCPLSHFLGSSSIFSLNTTKDCIGI